MSKHTPGPWFAGYRRSGSILSVKDSDGSVIAEICQWKTSADCSAKDEPPMNANLIAAAPDLLEALEMLLYTRTQERGLQNAKPGESPLHDRCRAAIAKARGES